MPTIEQLKELNARISLTNYEWDSIIKVLEAAKQVSYMLHVNDEGYVDTHSAADLAEALTDLESK